MPGGYAYHPLLNVKSQAQFGAMLSQFQSQIKQKASPKKRSHWSTGDGGAGKLRHVNEAAESVGSYASHGDFRLHFRPRLLSGAK